MFGCVTQSSQVAHPTSTPIVFSSLVQLQCLKYLLMYTHLWAKHLCQHFRHTVCVGPSLCRFPAGLCATFQYQLCGFMQGKMKYSVHACLHWIKPPTVTKCMHTYEISIHVSGDLCNRHTAEELWLRSPDSRESFTADALMSDTLLFLYRGLFVLCWMWWRSSGACSSFYRRVRQDNTIFILTCPLSADIPSAMTSLCLSPSGWWEIKQHSVSERRLSHC